MFRNSKLCRLCLVEVNSIVPIFSTKDVAETSSVQMKIMELANVQVYAGDGLPANVCDNCSKLLDEYHSFKTQIEKSDVLLRHQLSSSQTDPLSVEGKVEGSGSSGSVGSNHGEFVKAETLIIKDEDIDEEHVERILQPTRNESPSANTAANDDGNQDVDEDNDIEDDDDDDDEGEEDDEDDEDVDNDLGGNDDDDDDEDIEMDEEETDPLAGDITEPNIVEKPEAISDGNQQSNLLLLSGPLIVNNGNQSVNPSVVTPTTTFVAVPTNVPSTYVTVPSTAIKAAIPTATVTSDSTEKESDKNEPGPSTSKSDSTNPGEGSSLTGEQMQVDENVSVGDDAIQPSSVVEDEGLQPSLLVEATFQNEVRRSIKRYFELCGVDKEADETKIAEIRKEIDKRNRTCDICKKTFTTLRSVRRHKEFTHGTDIQYVPCNVCGKLLKTRDILRMHMQQCHSSESEVVNCEICYKQFRNKHALVVHRRNVHTSLDKQAACHICSKIFKHDKLLKKHIENTHSDKMCICSICGKSVRCIYSHMRHVHAEVKQLPCDQCGKIYNNDALLYAHKKKIHNTEKNYMCEICGASFKYKELLKTHYLVHRDERNFRCDICGKTFKQKTVLKTHQRVHNTVDPYICMRCGESFKWKQTFDKHTYKCTAQSILMNILK